MTAPSEGEPSFLTAYKKSKKRIINWKSTADGAASIGSLFAVAQSDDDPGHVYGFWHLLPDLLLERIFQFLTVRERYYASQKLLDHFRASIFLQRKGEHIRTLIIHPMNNLFNLYEFLNIALYLHNQMPDVLGNVHTLRFHFSCHLTQRSEELVFGTGGQLLSMLKKIMGMLPGLKTLELRDLLLEGAEGLHLLDDVCAVCCETLHTLILINTTKMAHTLLHPGAFINLQTLYISPQNIGEDLLELVANTTLKNMHIVQNKYTEYGKVLYYKAWKTCRQSNTHLRVHLESEGSCKKEILLQPCAPVNSIIYNSPYAMISTVAMLQLVEMYKRDLEMYGHMQLPKFYMPKSFHDRVDSTLLLLARTCPYIHTLIVREKVSTATVLLIAHTAKNLSYFYIRKNAIILKADWPYNPDWTPEFYSWLSKSARTYEAMEQEVSQILGYKWQALTDKQFKLLKINVDNPVFRFS